MKRLLTALLVCLYVTTLILSSFLPVVEAEGVESEPLSEGETVTEDGTEEEPEAAQPEWLSYYDYAADLVEKTYTNPALYVGFEALFDVDFWSNFQYASDPANTPAGEDDYIEEDALMDAQGKSVRIKIIGYAMDAEGQLWYQIEAAPGYTLPEVLVENPYIMHIADAEDTPSLLIMPMKAMFVGDTVEIKKEAVAATNWVTLSTAELPVFFDVLPTNGYWYDLGDTTGWHAELAENGYHYVDEACVYLIAPEVTVAYEKLQQATSAKEYNEIWESIPESVREQFTEQHLAVLDQRHEELNSVEYATTVTYNDIPLNVSVSGPIPETGVTLHVSAVSSQTVLDEGFDIENATEIITALDIKLLQEDESEWQPEDGQFVELNIGMAELGVPDGTVMRLHHKHGDKINVQEVFVVMDGKLNIRTTGFSIYVMENVGGTTGTGVANGGTVDVTIGIPRVLYFRTSNDKGTWIVDDPNGAIHYTVHSNEASSTAIGNSQVSARWIRIVGLKETTTPITLKYSTGNINNAETYYLNVKVPQADVGEKRLYIKDEVNTTGCLVAAVVDENGKEVSLAGAAFSWSREDDVNGKTFIVPAAYERNYQAVNIARDHGGLVEARKTDAAYVPTVYTLEVTLADGTELDAEYTVYYQSEIINAGFEFPDSKTRDYSFFPNGYPELYWKTTAPGADSGTITQDIEYGDVTGLTATSQGNTNYGVWRAADYDPETKKGVQFAELNAEEVGALYQDIITAPHEEIEWEFAHAKRPNQNWAPNVQNKMYLVIGATETAQRLTNDQLNTLVREAREKVGNNANFLDCKEPYKLTFSVDGAEYWVWYHNADNQTDYSATGNYGWAKLEGSYEVPDGQYRTRVFFVSDPDSNTSNKNAGNLIDTSSAGQYKHYLVEYYEQTYEGGVLVTKRIDEKQETGEALIYSSQKLENYDYFIETEHDYLYKILINGKNYPYDIRYANTPALYVEKYEGTPTDQLKGGKKYDEYEIVMQVFFRDTVVAVQKELEFPTALSDPDDPESPRVQLLTEEQKLTIMENLNKNDGYQATFKLNSTAEDDNYEEIKSAVITNRDPAGKYKGFVALGENPQLNRSYVIEETAVTQIPGLELDTVTFGVTRYSMGQEVNEDEDTLTFVSYDEMTISSGDPLICTPFKLENDIKIADVVVTNTYREKMTTIYYQAVGNGKVALTGKTDFADIPTEELAFYSGKAIGADIHCGKGATFAGWFKDEACTIPVTVADGVVDPDTKNFKPNSNIINADEVTFYALFTTGTIVINRTGAEEGQSFVYHVTGTTTIGTQVDLYLSLVCGEDGTGSTKITEVLDGTYTITEIDDWSWRYPNVTPGAEQRQVIHTGSNQVVDTVTFTSGMTQPSWWLSGLSQIARNIFKGGVTP